MTKLTIFKIAIGGIFIGSTIAAMISAGSLLNVVLRDYVFKVENCYYAPRILEEKDRGDAVEECRVDTNQTKRDVANGLAGSIVSIPVALYTFILLRKKEEA